MQPTLRRAAVLPLVILAMPCAARAQATVSHLTVYEAGVAELLEERTVQLQPGTNQIEWRSLVPKAFIRTLRVTADGAEVVRQDVSNDGAEVRNQRSPVLHLVVNNRGGARAARIRVDYMAPDLSWNGDYSLVLAPTAVDVRPPPGRSTRGSRCSTTPAPTCARERWTWSRARSRCWWGTGRSGAKTTR